jgi:hypothetical protein
MSLPNYRRQKIAVHILDFGAKSHNNNFKLRGNINVDDSLDPVPLLGKFWSTLG